MLHGDVAALGSSIDLDDAGAVEELTADTVGLGDPSVAAGAVAGVSGQGTEDKGQRGVEANSIALGHNDLVQKSTLGDDEGLAGLGVDQGGGNALALRVHQIAGKAQAVVLQHRAAAVAGQLGDSNSVDVGEGGITTDKAERVRDLGANVRRLNNVVEGHVEIEDETRGSVL